MYNYCTKHYATGLFYDIGVATWTASNFHDNTGTPVPIHSTGWPIIHELGHTSEEKDIGVIIDSNLEFDKDVQVYVKDNKANSTIVVIRKSVQKLDEDTFVPLYEALVRTHLDYACCIW